MTAYSKNDQFIYIKKKKKEPDTWKLVTLRNSNNPELIFTTSHESNVHTSNNVRDIFSESFCI